MVATALFDSWHGYDRLINGMRKDIATVKKNKIRLHLVGYGRVLSKYKRMIKKYQLEDYVIIHGRKSGKDLDEIYNMCDIAIDSLARHRVGVFYNSTLKGKEYCAYGFPIISGVETELDHIENYSFYFRFPSNESAISIKTILSCYNSWYKNRKSDEIAYYIRNLTYNFFDIRKTYMPVIEYINKKIKTVNGDKQ